MASREQGRRPVDYPLIVIITALLIVGLMMVYSSTFTWAQEESDDAAYYLKRQLGWLLAGIVACILVTQVEYHLWSRVSIILMAGALGLLVLVLAIGPLAGGAQRTLIGRSVQPSEIAKLVVVIYVAHWLSSKGEQIRKVTYGLMPFSILVGLVAALIVLQPDFSTAILIVLTAVTMFYLAGADLLQLFGALTVGVVAFAATISRSPHASNRIASHIATLRNPISESSWHLGLALMALGTGGTLGRGLGQGRVPVVLPHTDSIFAVLGEEMGLLGCLLVIGLYAGLAYRGFLIASQAPDGFGAMLAAGVTCWLTFQAFIHAAVITGTIPFTGIPLPFVSSGGSSLVTCLTGVGLILSVSRGSIEKRKSDGNTSGVEDVSVALGGRDRRPRLSRTSRSRHSNRR